MPTKLPKLSSSLTPNDMRMFTLDTSAQNNLLDLDLTWSEQEILEAMRRCALMWNGIPPQSVTMRVDPLSLPAEYVFMAGTAYQMYLAKLQQYQRGDLEYAIGGVQTNIFGKRIAHFQQNLAMLRDEFVQLTSAQKANQNMANAWGAIG